MKSAAVMAGLGAALLASGGSVRADVWEFDRRGNVLVSPEAKSARNGSYDADARIASEHPLVTKSTRGVNRAIYRPMAEGVAAVYAEDPAVLAAGLDAADFVRLFVALIDQESRFDPTAVSPKGARGLGQLMPETAALLGVADPSEPMANLHGAARYLTTQLAAFGRVDWALAAYNSGPHRVEQYRGVPPYSETRDYVARITAAADLPMGADMTPRPEIGRGRTAALDPELLEPLEPEASDATPLDQPVQGTLLEWKR